MGNDDHRATNSRIATESGKVPRMKPPSPERVESHGPVAGTESITVGRKVGCSDEGAPLRNLRRELQEGKGEAYPREKTFTNIRS